MKQIRSLGLLIFVGVLWWGLVYPELCFMEGTYEIAAEVTADALKAQKEKKADSKETEDTKAGGESADSEKTEEELLKGLFEAGPGRIIIKSKMLHSYSRAGGSMED